MHLTAIFKLRTNNRDAALLRTALARWHAALTGGLARARADLRDGRSELLRCLVLWTSKDGQVSRLTIDAKRLHSLVLGWLTPYETHLHSSATMSLVVALEEQL